MQTAFGDTAWQQFSNFVKSDPSDQSSRRVHPIVDSARLVSCVLY